MSPREFHWFPVSMDRQRSPLGGPATYVGFSAYYDPSGPNGPEAGIEFQPDGREWDVAEVIVDGTEEFTFVTAQDERITFRHTIPADAAASEQFQTPMDLPVEIIGALMSGTTDIPSLAAAVDAQGDVHTMILESGLGLYARYAGTWLRLTDISPIEQLSIVDVAPDDLAIYDEADQQGNMLNVGDLNVLDDGYQTAIEASVPPASTSVVAAARPAAALIVASAAELPDAIAWADAHPESRWYVARRARALKYEGALPWE